jgi:hypothetical protein
MYDEIIINGNRKRYGRMHLWLVSKQYSGIHLSEGSNFQPDLN